MKTNPLQNIKRDSAAWPIICSSLLCAGATGIIYLLMHHGQRPDAFIFGAVSTIGYWILFNFAFDRARKADSLSKAMNEDLIAMLLVVMGLLFLLFTVCDENDRTAAIICYFLSWFFLIIYIFEMVVTSIALTLLQKGVALRIKRLCE